VGRIGMLELSRFDEFLSALNDLDPAAKYSSFAGAEPWSPQFLNTPAREKLQHQPLCVLRYSGKVNVKIFEAGLFHNVSTFKAAACDRMG
jgi:hypothetical protein